MKPAENEVISFSKGYPAAVAVAGLLDDILGRGVSLRICVTGGSMSPFLESGDTVILKRTPFENLEFGDLLLFRDSDGLPILHRIVFKTGRSTDGFVVTKGDAIGTTDFPVRAENILGKVERVERFRRGLLGRSMDMMSPLMRSFKKLRAARGALGFRLRRSPFFS